MNKSHVFESGVSSGIGFRRVGAVLAGVGTVVVLSVGTDVVLRMLSIFPPVDVVMGDRLFVLATLYRVMYAVLGSYVAARWSPDRSMAHAMAVGLVGFGLGVVGILATWNDADGGAALGPRWYPIALIATALPCGWVGGKMWVGRQGAKRAGA